MSFLGGLRAITASRATGALLRPAPTFSHVKLLLHAEGTPGSQVYTDSSSFSRNIPAASGVVLSTAQSYWGTSSVSFSGASGLLVPASFDNPAEWLQLGSPSHPVTIECSLFFSTSSGRRFLFGTGEWGVSFAPKGDGFSFHNNGVIDSTLNVAQQPSGIFLNLAFQISTDFTTGNKKKFEAWINGLYQGALVLDHPTYSLVRPPPGDAGLRIGADPSGNFVGYLDEFRVSEELLYGPVNYSLATGPFADADGPVTLSGGFGRDGSRTVFLNGILSAQAFGLPSVLSSGITLVSIFEGTLGTPGVSVETSLSGVVSSEAFGSLSVADSTINLVGIASAEAVGSVTVDAASLTAFRFWRLNLIQWATAGVVGSGSGTDVRVGDLAYFVGATEYPPTNMLDNVTPSPYVASVSDSSYGIAANCFNKDSSDTLRWISSASGGTHWVSLDVGTPLEITSFQLSPDGAASIGYYPVDFTITASNTGSFTGEEVTKFSATGVTSGWSNNTLRTFYIGSSDPYLSNVDLLLHGDGTGIVDSSVHGWVPADFVNVAPDSGGSGYFGDAQLGVTSGFAKWNDVVIASAGTYTIEGFFDVSNFTSPRVHLFGCWNVSGQQGWTLDVDTSGELQLALNSGLASVSGSTSLSTGTRFHLALQLTLGASSTTAEVWINGTSAKTFSGSAISNFGSTSFNYAFRLGSRSDNTLAGVFKVEELRVTRGARYAPGGSFTPPSVAYSGFVTPALGLSFSTVSGVDFSNRNSTALTSAVTANWAMLPLTSAVPTTGSWYVEFDTTGITGHQMFGATTGSSAVTGRYLGQSGSGVPELSLGDGSRLEGSVFTWVDSTDVPSSGTSSIGLSINQTTGNLRWYSNGVLQPANASFTAGTAGIYFAIGSYFARGPVTLKPAASATIPSGFTYLT